VPGSKYPHHREQIAFTTDLLERLRRIPGTQAVAAAPGRPLDQAFGPTTVFNIVGRPKNPPEKEMGTAVLPASSDFFRALGIPLVRGRVYTPAEDHNAPQVLVVNQEFVRRYFKTEDPIGLRIILSFTSDGVDGGGEIIGIVGNVKQKSLSEETYPAAYIPFSGLPIPEAFVVRSTADPALVEAAIRTQVAELDPDVSLFGLTTLSDAVSASVAQPRFYSILLGAFAGIALLLAALGIYGVVSYTVSQRTRELGIRIALGATTDRVVRLVIGSGMLLTVTGVAIGIVAALGLTRTIASLLFGVTAFDPMTLGVVSVVLIGVAGLASWLPARRAAKVDPVIAMRAE
jgi:putative ABC transport system permease protein